MRTGHCALLNDMVVATYVKKKGAKMLDLHILNYLLNSKINVGFFFLQRFEKRGGNSIQTTAVALVFILLLCLKLNDKFL